MTHFFTHHGLPLLFVVITLESFGIPLPGETALIIFGVLASQGNYGITEVIVVAATAAIVGDNLGYWVIGRIGGRDDDHPFDRVVPLRGEDAEGDERRLARERDPERLEIGRAHV